MSEKVESFKCNVCSRIFTNEEDAMHENHKVAETRGDPIARIY